MSTLLRLPLAALALLPAWLLSLRLRRRSSRGKVIASLRLSGGLSEQSTSRSVMSSGSTNSFFEILQMVRLAGEESAVRGLALRIGGLEAGWAQLQELRDEIDTLQRRGRTVFAYLDAPGHAELFLASACDHITMAPLASLDVVGLRAEVTFVRGALEKAGVTPHFEHAGDYKSYGEMFTRDSMSAEHRESLDMVLRGVHDGFLDAVAGGRTLARERLQELVDGGPYSAQEARGHGLVDEVLYPDAWRRLMRRNLGDLVPEPGEARQTATPKRERHQLVSLGRFLRPNMFARRLWGVIRPRKAVVVLRLGGNIVDSDSPHAPAGRIAARPTAAVLKALRRDDNVAAVVLRIDSPGGSGLASDMMWRELKRLAAKKPLVASMGNIAASGGYYLAMAGDEVLADPLTITGSIGVVAGKFEVSELLERLGVRRDVLSYGQNSGMNSLTAGWTESERERVREHIEMFYAAFVTKAADCRGVEVSELAPHADGRIWTGTQALERGLVDALGSTYDAVRRAAVRARVGADYEVLFADMPRPSVFSRLRQLPLAAERLLLRRVEERLQLDLWPAQDGVQARLPFGLRIR